MGLFGFELGFNCELMVDTSTGCARRWNIVSILDSRGLDLLWCISVVQICAMPEIKQGGVDEEPVRGASIEASRPGAAKAPAVCCSINQFRVSL
jgi:hypothetical protein